MNKLTLASMARHYGVFPATIRHYIKAGRLPEPENTTMSVLRSIPYPSNQNRAKGPGVRGGTVAARKVFGVSRSNRRHKYGNRSNVRGTTGMPVVRREHVLMAIESLKKNNGIEQRLELMEKKIDLIIKYLVS